MPGATRRRGAVAVVVLLAALMASATPVRGSTLATLELSKERVRPGEEVSFRGWYYNDTHPVLVRWESPGGAVLATATPDTFGLVHNHWRSIAGTLTIPVDATPGLHVLVATQDFAAPAKITWGVPARTEIEVGEGDGGSAVGRTSRGETGRETIATVGLPDLGNLLGAAAAGAGLAVLLAGIALLARKLRVAA